MLVHVPFQRILVGEPLLADLTAVRLLAIVDGGDVCPQSVPVKRVERTVRAHQVLRLFDFLLTHSARFGAP